MSPERFQKDLMILVTVAAIQGKIPPRRVAAELLFAAAGTLQIADISEEEFMKLAKKAWDFLKADLTVEPGPD